MKTNDAPPSVVELAQAYERAKSLAETAVREREHARAQLIAALKDLREDAKGTEPDPVPEIAQKRGPYASRQIDRVLGALGTRPLHVADVARRSGVSIQCTCHYCALLLKRGLIKRVSKGVYRKA